NPAFQALSSSDSRGIGTHSYRKFPSQYAVDKGASPDDVEIRGAGRNEVTVLFLDISTQGNYIQMPKLKAYFVWEGRSNIK
ncbi:hypothetical protein G9A89_000603, partial [Geosiphon pyriformis]